MQDPKLYFCFSSNSVIVNLMSNLMFFVKRERKLRNEFGLHYT